MKRILRLHGPLLGASLARMVRVLFARVVSTGLCVALAFGQLSIAPGRAFAEDPNPGVASGASSKPTVVRELAERRTETAKHYLMSDGSFKAVMSEVPIHFKDDSGNWADIETELVPSENPNSYVTKAAAVRGRFGTQLDGQPVRVEGDGYSIGIDMVGVAEGAKLVWGNKARYINVAPDTSLEYESLDDGVKETLVLGSTKAPSEFGFDMTFSGLEIRTVRPGEWALFRPGQSEPVLGVGGLCVFDSSENGAGDPAYCPETTMTVTPVQGGARITYEISKTWLSDPARKFPVFIDPTTTKSIYIDNFVSSAYPGTTYGSSTEIKTGYYDSTTGHNRGLVKFDVLGDLNLAGAYIDSATLSLYQFHTYYTDTPAVTYLGKVTKSWSEASTWNSLGCTVNNEAGLATNLSSQSPHGRNIWVNWSVGPTVQSWVSGAVNYGFMTYQNEGDSAQMPECWRKFYSSEYSDTTLRPKLVVNYSHPTSEISQYVSSYRLGDTVRVQVLARSYYWDSINDLRLLINYMGNDSTPGGDAARYRGYLRWSLTDPEPGDSNWKSEPAYSAAGQQVGFVSKYLNSTDTYGSGKITLLPSQCQYGADNVGTESSYRRIVFAFKVNDSWGDTQQNDLDTWFAVGDNGWNGDWKWNDTNVNIRPKPVEASYETTSSSWLYESDTDGDGLPAANDDPEKGRGSVTLTWPQDPIADGYRIYLDDGHQMRQVGTAAGKSNTSWSTAGSSVYPSDSEIASLSAQYSGNPFTGATCPSAESHAQTLSLSGQTGGGVVLSDANYLYVRAWSTYGGPTTWTRFGKSGGTGTAVGPSFAAKPILSAVRAGSYLYNGYADTKTTLTRLALPGGATSTLTLTNELLARDTGNELTAASSNLMLAGDSDHLYSIAFGRGTTYSGYRIREFTMNGSTVATWTGTDHDIKDAAGNTITHSYYIDGAVVSDGYIYLIEWGGNHRIVKVRLNDWTVCSEWVSDQSSTNVINGCWDEATKSFYLGCLSTGNVHRYSAPGMDLRDNPRPLYQKTAGAEFDERYDYRFKVVPFDDYAGDLAISEAATVCVGLDNRTVGINDEVRHVVHKLDDIAEDKAMIQFDTGAFQLISTDIEGLSWGPAANLSRFYSSSSTSTGLFGPGWRFDFERSLQSVNASTAVYVDEAGQSHIFRKIGGDWHPPRGFRAQLQVTDIGAGETTASLTFKDRSRVLFDADGRLDFVEDAFANRCDYDFSALDGQGSGQLVITSPNLQTVTVGFQAGRVVRATWHTGDGNRVVSYETTTSQSETRSVVTLDYGTTDSHSVEYVYTDGRITSITEGQGVWSVEYSGNAVETIREPVLRDGRRPSASTSYWQNLDGSHGAGLVASADVSGTSEFAKYAYDWNPSVTVRQATPLSLTEEAMTWGFAYNPDNEVIRTVSPTGSVREQSLDCRGNVIWQRDAEGNITASEYNQYDNLTKQTGPRGESVTYEYESLPIGSGQLSGAGPVKSIEREIDAATSQRAELDYDSFGRVVFSREQVDPDDWRAAAYDYAGSPADKATVTSVFSQHYNPGTGLFEDAGVALSATSTVERIYTQQRFNQFGDLLSESLPSSTLSTSTYSFSDAVYSSGGRLLSSRDVDGVTTHNSYDVFGRLVETSMTASIDPTQSPRVTNWFRYGYDAAGNLDTESSVRADGSVDTVKTHTYDLLGRETAVCDSVEGTTTTWFDVRGNVVASWEPGAGTPGLANLSKADQEGFDAEGRSVWSRSAGATQSATTEYSPNGLVERQTEEDGSWVSYVYDASGNLVTQTEPTGDPSSPTASTTYTYDLAGRRMSATNPEGLSVSYTYDLAGELVGTTSGGQSVGSAVFNELGWQLEETDAAGIKSTTSYDVAGNEAQVVKRDANNAVVSDVRSIYDAKKRLISSVSVESGGPSEVEFTYDPFGRVIHERHSKNGVDVKNIITDYDEFDREILIDDLGTGITKHVAYGRPGVTQGVESLSFRGVETTSTINPRGLLIHQETRIDNGAGALSVDREVEWDEVKSVPLESAIAIDGVVRSQSFSYGPDNRIDSIGGDLWGSGGTQVSYDTTNTASKTGDTVTLPWGGTTARSFSYSKVGRLTNAVIGARTLTYNWSTSGNGDLISVADKTGSTTVTTTINYTAGHISTLTKGASVTTYLFDQAGRRTKETTSGGYVEWGWTGENLTSWKSVNGSQVESATYGYDADGQRMSALVHARSPWSSQTTDTTYTYGWDDLSLCWVHAESEAASATMIYLFDEMDRPYLGRYEATRSGEATSAAFRLLLNDHGDVLGLVSSDGEQFGRYSYGPFGEPEGVWSRGVSQVSSAVAGEVMDSNFLRYAAYDFDPWSSAYYLQARYYDPNSRQFTSRDPDLADGGEESAYQYCSGDPIGKTDPTGAWGFSFRKALKSARDFVKKSYSSVKHAVDKLYSSVSNSRAGKVMRRVFAKAKGFLSRERRNRHGASGHRRHRKPTTWRRHRPLPKKPGSRMLSRKPTSRAARSWRARASDPAREGSNSTTHDGTPYGRQNLELRTSLPGGSGSEFPDNLDMGMTIFSAVPAVGRIGSAYLFVTNFVQWNEGTAPLGDVLSSLSTGPSAAAHGGTDFVWWVLNELGVQAPVIYARPRGENE